MAKQVVSQLSWGHVLRLLQRGKNPEIRTWCARQAIVQTGAEASWNSRWITRQQQSAQESRKMRMQLVAQEAVRLRAMAAENLTVPHRHFLEQALSEGGA
jgi:hypothetical protein